MTTTIHRTTARRWTRLAQALVLVLIVGAVAVAGAGMPFLAEPEPLDLDAIRDDVSRVEPGDEATDDQTTTEPAFDAQFVASQLAMVNNAPVPIVDEAPVDDDPQDLNDPGPTGDTGAVALLGSIISPTRRVAVLRVDGRQLLVAQGQERMGIEVEEVGDGFVRITRDGEALRIDRAQRKAGQLTTMANPGFDRPPPAVLNPGMRQPGQRAGTGRGAEDGIDPELIAERQAQRRAELIQQSDARRADRARRRGEVN